MPYINEAVLIHGDILSKIKVNYESTQFDSSMAFAAGLREQVNSFKFEFEENFIFIQLKSLFIRVFLCMEQICITLVIWLILMASTQVL